jgi:hypothetical protein
MEDSILYQFIGKNLAAENTDYADLTQILIASTRLSNE